MDTGLKMQTFDAVTADDIPQSAKTAIEYAMWVCEREGLVFQNGSTACYWNLLADLAKHMHKETE